MPGRNLGHSSFQRFHYTFNCKVVIIVAMIGNACKVCNKEFNDENQVRRHLRRHNITAEQYTLKWAYSDVVPKCQCGCGNETSWNVALKDYTKFVHGHHAYGRIKSDDEKRRIGEKNSINMKNYYDEHPELRALKNQQLRSGITSESEVRRINSTKTTYSEMSSEDKQKFSEHSKSLWKTGDIMKLASIKGGKTYHQRFLNGEYNNVERNIKISNTISQKYVDGSWKFSKGSYTSTKTGKACYYRSSWELQMMKELDVDSDVIDWESEFTSIPYIYNNAQHRYIPDFHVTRLSEHELIEVKPLTLRSTERNIAKRNAAISFCKQNGWSYSEWEPS